MIVDDGSGFETTRQREGHYGLLGIEERIGRLGGTVRLTSAIRRGTSVSIRVPRSKVCVVPDSEANAHRPLGEAVN